MYINTSNRLEKYGITKTTNNKIIHENNTFHAIRETLIITIITFFIGYILNHDDPFTIKADYPWCILAPLLIGLRYGFIYGFASALLYVLVIVISTNLGLIQIESFPSGLSVGLLLTGMLAGEFRDIWKKMNYQLEVENLYNENRLLELSKGYLLLQVSHNLLEQKVLGSPVSLRSILMRLKDSMPQSEINNGSSLSGIADNILSLFGEYGGVQIASLYQVANYDEFAKIDFEPIGIMGRPIPVTNNNSLIQETLRTGNTTVATKQHSPGDEGVIAVIPIVNIHKEVLALLTINEMEYVDYNDKTFDLLTLIGGYLGDAVSNVGLTDGMISFTKENFNYHIKRSLLDIKKCDIDVSLLVLNIRNNNAFNHLYKIVRQNSRILDQLWVPGLLERASTICILMPLTDKSGVDTYIERIKVLCSDKNNGFTGSDLSIFVSGLSKYQSSSDVFEYISHVSQNPDDVNVIDMHLEKSDLKICAK
jgi:hypothetical protein